MRIYPPTVRFGATPIHKVEDIFQILRRYTQ
jgi:hypothetical protein